MGQSISGCIKPVWEEIENKRVECIDFLDSNDFTKEIIDAIVMVFGELLENAIKYGDFEKHQDDITFCIDISSQDITIEVSNPVDEENSEHLKKFDSMVQWIRGFQNPFEAYIERLKEVSARPLDNKESGLGLVRIAYEGQSILDFFLDENDNISVSAIYQL